MLLGGGINLSCAIARLAKWNVSITLLFESIQMFRSSDKISKLACCHIHLLIISLLFSSQNEALQVRTERWVQLSTQKKKNLTYSIGQSWLSSRNWFKVPVDQFSFSHCVNLGTYDRWRRANPLGLSFLFQQECLKWEGPGNHNDNLKPIILRGLCVNLHFSSSKLCVLLLPFVLCWCFWDRKEKPGQKTCQSKW